ncbi:MAG TPA: hypothetical protein VET26_05810 [Candidatus Sulfotelmatobacter sp.]|nr:hypothetical protein [Candidatus Sulfotelmatobacter sp.]
MTAGPAGTTITVNGGSFLPNEQTTLYWDPPSTKVAGSATADGSGNFSTHVKPFAGDALGVHRLCASVPPSPCANFTLEAAVPTPSPSPSPSPDTSPSPSPSAATSPTPLESPTPAAATLNGFDVISRPPFVFLPIVGAMAILISIAYWILSIVRRPRPVAMPTAAVVHRASRPDYTAAFGAPPPPAPAAAPPPSAWADVLPTGIPPSTPPAAEPEAASPELPPAPDEPPDLPEPVED